MMLANCLNLPCRVFKQFACSSDAFKSFYFLSVKYFNKPKPCRIFFRCLNCAPHPFLCYFVCHFSPIAFFGVFFFYFIFCPFDASLVFLISTCGQIPRPNPKLFSHSQHVLWEFTKILILSIDLKTCFIGSQFLFINSRFRLFLYGPIAILTEDFSAIFRICQHMSQFS